MVLLVFMMVVSVNLLSLRRRYALLFRGASGQDLESIVVGLVSEISALQTKVFSLEEQHKDHDALLDSVVAGVGVVRFSAFENVGGDQSFVVALLNRRGDGVVFTSLFGTNESRFYAKPIKGKTSDYNLSEEEVLAIDRAVEAMRKSARA